jgi:hypothetical protein
MLADEIETAEFKSDLAKVRRLLAPEVNCNFADGDEDHILSYVGAHRAGPIFPRC